MDGELISLLLLAILLVAVTVKLMVDSNKLDDPNDNSVLHVDDIASVSNLSKAKKYALSIIRQSGNIERETIFEAEGQYFVHYGVLKNAITTLDKAGIDSVVIETNRSDLLKVRRIYYSHRGRQEGKKVFGFEIRAFELEPQSEEPKSSVNEFWDYPAMTKIALAPLSSFSPSKLKMEKCSPVDFFNYVSVMLRKSGMTAVGATSAAKAITEVFDIQTTTLLELIDGYKKGELKEAATKKRILQEYDTLFNNNQIMLKKYLVALKKSLVEDGSPYVDAFQVAEKYENYNFDPLIPRHGAPITPPEEQEWLDDIHISKIRLSVSEETLEDLTETEVIFKF